MIRMMIIINPDLNNILYYIDLLKGMDYPNSNI